MLKVVYQHDYYSIMILYKAQLLQSTNENTNLDNAIKYILVLVLCRQLV